MNRFRCNLRSLSACVFATIGLVGLAARSSAAADPLDDVEKNASEWVKLRVETKRLETAWQQEHALVESMAASLKERATAAEEKRDLVKAKTARDREEFDAIRAKNQTAIEDLHAVEARLQTLTTRLAALRPSLPPRLSEALEMSYRSLAAKELAAAERMQLAMTVLNRCAQFNRVVTVGEDILTLDGEPAPKSLEVIYWGLSHGYAIDRATHRAWIGAPDAGTWRWQPQPDAFSRVVQLIAIANDKADPDFIVVPAKLARSLGETTKN